MEGTPYEQSYDNYNTSLEGGKFALKGTDGLKTGSSPTADYNYTATIGELLKRLFSEMAWSASVAVTTVSYLILPSLRARKTT